MASIDWQASSTELHATAARSSTTLLTRRNAAPSRPSIPRSLSEAMSTWPGTASVRVNTAIQDPLPELLGGLRTALYPLSGD